MPSELKSVTDDGKVRQRRRTDDTELAQRASRTLYFVVKEGKRASPLHHISLFQTVTGNQRRQDVESVRHTERFFRVLRSHRVVNSAAFSRVFSLCSARESADRPRWRREVLLAASARWMDPSSSFLTYNWGLGLEELGFCSLLHSISFSVSIPVFADPFIQFLSLEGLIYYEICIYQVNKCVCWGSCAIRALEAKSGVSNAWTLQNHFLSRFE